MTKDTSKEICKICEIEPKYRLLIPIGDLDSQWDYTFNERKYRLIADNIGYIRYGDYHCDTKTIQERLDLIELVYPDFGLPNNFVKLLNLDLKKYGQNITLFNYISCYMCVSHSTILENYIQTLYNILTDENIHEKYTINKNYKKMIIQAIKETEWEYIDE